MEGALSTPKTRGKLLTGWLIFMILSNVWVAYRYWAIIQDRITHGQQMTGPLYSMIPVLLVLALVNVVAIMLLFLWKRLGFYGLVATSAIAFVINIIAGVPIVLTLLGLVGLGILWVLLQSRWQDFT